MGVRYRGQYCGTNQLISKHLGFYLTPDGRLAIVGSKYFWGNFIIWFPNQKYRRIIGVDTEFLSLTAVDGKTYTSVSALLSGGGANPDYVLYKEAITRNDDDTLWTLTEGIAATDTVPYCQRGTRLRILIIGVDNPISGLRETAY